MSATSSSLEPTPAQSHSHHDDEEERQHQRRQNQDSFARTTANNRSSPETFFRIENWYPLIKDFTPAIEIVPLSRSEAKALTKYKEISKMLLIFSDMQQQEIDHSSEFGHWDSNKMEKIDAKMVEAMGEDQAQLIRDIRTKLDILIEKFGRSAFVKLSTRSPKGIMSLKCCFVLLFCYFFY